MPLDRSRPFGELRPPEGGAVFVQDGALFRADGSDLAPAAPTNSDEPVKRKPGRPRKAA